MPREFPAMLPIRITMVAQCATEARQRAFLFTPDQTSDFVPFLQRALLKLSQGCISHAQPSDTASRTSIKSTHRENTS